MKINKIAGICKRAGMIRLYVAAEMRADTGTEED